CRALGKRRTAQVHSDGSREGARESRIKTRSSGCRFCGAPYTRHSSAVRIASGDSRHTSSLSLTRTRWTTQALVASQVSICVLVMIVCGLFIRTVHNLKSQDTGYVENRLLVADVEFPRQYSEARRDQLINDLVSRIRALHGVETAGFSHVGQLTGRGIEYKIHL